MRQGSTTDSGAGRTEPGDWLSRICRRLGGGGHPRAAGCEISGNLDNAKHAILEEVKKELDRAEAEKNSLEQ